MEPVSQKFYVESSRIRDAIGGPGLGVSLEAHLNQEVMAEIYNHKTEQTYFLSGILVKNNDSVFSISRRTVYVDKEELENKVPFNISNLRKLLVPCGAIPNGFTRTQPYRKKPK